jgi:ATP-dependent Clp protease ATP-binding subunit ClpA
MYVCRLAGKRLLLLDVARVVAGTSYRGEFEERLQGLLAEVEGGAGAGPGGGALLFVDEIHVLGERGVRVYAGRVGGGGRGSWREGKGRRAAVCG